MTDTSATTEKELGTFATENAMKKAGENIGNRAVNWVIDTLSDRYGKRLVLTKTVYRRYLDKAYLRYNQVKTLVTGIAPRPIIGTNSIYLKVGVNHNGKEYDTSTVNELLTISRNLLICGTGGAGKSMLMRYLFLNTVNRGEYIPVLLELRKISENSPSEKTFMELIYKCMQDFDTELPHEQFEYSLRLGKYIFFLDGFDEIKSTLAENAAEAIQKFAAKYPENAYIITSRPDRDFSSLETFTRVKTKELSKNQAVILSEKFWEKDEKTIEFCKQLEDSLYDLHKDFAQNPLLLSMMFLTFMHNGNIPDHRVDFYEKCYAALYNMHDNRNKGKYKREFECESLNEQEFKLLFSRFCYKTYIDNEYEFSEDKIIGIINMCIIKLQATGMLKTTGITAHKYLNDLRKVLCLIVREGNTYRFAHRSLQAYFAAVYVTSLPDERQKLFYDDILQRGPHHLQYDAFLMAYQLSPERFMRNALEHPLRILSEEMSASNNAEHYLLKKLHTEEFEFSFRMNKCQLSVMRKAFVSKDHIFQNAIYLLRVIEVEPDWTYRDVTFRIFSFAVDFAKHVKWDAAFDNTVRILSFDQLEFAGLVPRYTYSQLVNTLIGNDDIRKMVTLVNHMLEYLDNISRTLKLSSSVLDDL